MINLPIKKLKQGMIMAQSLYNSSGGAYLTKGTRLNDQYIGQLQKVGIASLTVTSLNPNISLPPPTDLVQEKTRITAIKRVFETYSSLSRNGRVDMERLSELSETILIDLFNKKSSLAQLTDIRLHDSYTFAHSVNVAILAAMIGTHCNYEKGNLLVLTLGSLLHDIGKLIIPVSILNKRGRLDDDEFNLIKMHPAAGQRKINEIKIPNATIIAAIAGQHHEHFDGSGYPNRLTGTQIHRFARIVSIADVYDALTSDRPYKKAYSPHVAYNIMTKCSSGQFDLELLKIFFDHVAIYPVGTILKTNVGYGIVKDIQFGKTLTPTICLFATNERKSLTQPTDINLFDNTDVTIENVLSDSELYKFLHELGIDPAVYLTKPEDQTN